MKAVKARTTAAFNLGATMSVVDNSGARIARIVSTKKGKSKKGKQNYAKIADLVNVAVKKGKPETKGKVFPAIVVRQKKAYKRKTGEMIAFEDNALVLLKDEKGNPKGTQIKGPIAREIMERWPQVAKIASIVY